MYSNDDLWDIVTDSVSSIEFSINMTCLYCFWPPIF